MIFYKRGLMTAVLLMVVCASCRTTSPRASALHEGSPATASVADATIGKAVLPAYQPPSGLKPQILQWVVVNLSSPAAADGEFAWNVDLRSGMEIWCERLCSEFSLQTDLVTTPQGGVQRLVAVKKSIQGNTSPGMLSVKKDVRGKRADAKQVLIENVGIQGNSVVLDDVISGDKTNFYAVPMKLSVAVADGTLLGEFMDRKVVIKLAPGVEKPKVSKDTEPLTAFVMGTLLKATSGNAKGTGEFLASKIITPWSGD
jgi:hypothetical protein